VVRYLDLGGLCSRCGVFFLGFAVLGLGTGAEGEGWYSIVYARLLVLGRGL